MPVPVHTVTPTPSPAQQTPNGNPSTGPAAPGSPQSNPGNDAKNDNPKTDSVEDIRNDMDHEPGGLGEVHPDDQDRLEDSFPQNPDGTPQRFPDPFGAWVGLQNDGGDEVPGRSNNCADCSRSFIESYRGNPQVSAPRTLDTDEHGVLDTRRPEDDANANQIRWAGAPHTYAGTGSDPDTAARIEQDLLQAGHGSTAIVQVDWPNGGGHAFAAINHNGTVVWVDSQGGEVSYDPLHLANADHVWHIPMDPDGNPLHPVQNTADDSEGQNDESQNQNNDASQPENSESSGQPESSESNPQNDTSSDIPKQGDAPDTDTNSPATDPATPDASNNGVPEQSSTADPNPTPDPTNDKPESETGQLQGESDKPSQPDSMPDGQEPSQDTADSPKSSPDNGNADAQPQQSPSPETPSEQNHPTPAETPSSTPDQQSHPDDPTRPDEQGRAPDKESQQPTSTTDSTAPPRTTPDSQSDPTTNRDTPHQTTTPSDPRTSIPHQQTGDPSTTDPRAADPRTTDPRTSDPRTSDPRTPDPNRDTPTQQKPETGEWPDGRDPNTSPRPDQTRPDHLDDPRSETPDKDPSETPDQTRPDDSNRPPAEDHRDRPSDMNKDSAVPTRESLPDGKNADAANYVKDSVNGKKPLYGDIAPENPAENSRPNPERPSGPAEPAGSSPDNQASRRQRDLDMLARANEGMRARNNDEQSAARTWFEKYYHPNSGRRQSQTNPAEDGRPVPQLHPTNDPNAPWMLANDAPDADPESYIDDGAGSGKRHEGISQKNLEHLDEAALARQEAIDADDQPHKDRQAAKEAYEKNKTEENEKKFEEADAKHSPLHGEMGRASEEYGEQVAEFHAMPRHFPTYTRIDDRGTGRDRFDQIWMDPNTDPPEFVVVEAKGSLKTGLGDRRGLPEHAGPDPSAGQDNSPGQDQGDSDQNDQNDDSGQDAPTPSVPKVKQGTRAYFETILHVMEERADRNEDKAKTDAEREAAKAERKLARDLRKALEANPPRVKYILVKGNSSGGQHQGYEMKQFDTRTEAEKQSDADSTT
ncbi:hypothetical protein J7I98_02550 [Streptomyces sp. ISL-98]|uniref:toxin glutamine deamidase domain-containing protein n=1 Tax=Streptomyces sp. ISL-98 TaxID=2819192 RepID=UPI001BECBAA9|nr:toxin glutamine deamidase domain-containing protein [Streptomyces sp. ISL-98]MBT2504791.1 hypothetical protein [Streptomyces sp. ISL-98]